MLNIIRLKMKNMYPQDMDITLHVYDEEGSKETSRSSIVPFVVSIQAPNASYLQVNVEIINNNLTKRI